MWESHTCDKCKKTNHVDYGDPQDVTGRSPDPACQCWFCDHVFWIVDYKDNPDDIENWDDSLSPEENLENMGHEEGEPFPEYRSRHYEKLLDTVFLIDVTFRGFIYQRLADANNSRQITWDPLDKRSKVVKDYAKFAGSDADPYRQELADFFNKSDEFSVHEYGSTRDERTGKTSIVGINWKDVQLRMRSILSYLFALELG